MKKVLLILALIFTGFSLMACNLNEDEYSDYSYLSLEINPAVDFVIDKDEKVTTYQFRNEEAEVVAAGLDLIGKNYEEALQLYLNAAIDTGYLDVTRDDGAIMVQTGGKNDEENLNFMNQVQTHLQNFLQENAIGAVVMNFGEVDTETKEYAQTNDVSYGFAKMVLNYLEINPDANEEDALEMTPKEIMDELIENANQYRSRYTNQIQNSAQAIKDELVEALRSQVQAHRDSVDQGTKSQPDISGLKTMYQSNFESMKSAYQTRNQERLQQAKDKTVNTAPMFFSVDINPGIDFIADKDGYILSYRMRNEAAEIVAAGLEMEGLHYQEALQLYLNNAVDTGYIDVERTDNAVMIQNSGETQDLENQFRNQLQTKVQNFFSENAIGGIALNQHEFNEEVSNFAETYSITYGFAQLVMTYLATDEALVIKEVLEMKASEIIEELDLEYGQYLSQYRNQREADAEQIKNGMVNTLKQKVEQHRDAVEQGTKTQPDVGGLKTMYQQNYNEIHEGYLTRNQNRVQEAKNQINKP
jgi:hypothetical protein